MAGSVFREMRQLQTTGLNFNGTFIQIEWYDLKSLVKHIPGCLEHINFKGHLNKNQKKLFTIYG